MLDINDLFSHVENLVGELHAHQAMHRGRKDTADGLLHLSGKWGLVAFVYCHDCKKCRHLITSFKDLQVEVDRVVGLKPSTPPEA